MQGKEESVEQAADRCALFMAHPGHELFLYGWVRRVKPRVFVVTDGSGHGETSRLSFTKTLLRSIQVKSGSVFGRFTDRQLYAAVLRGQVRWATDLAAELASFLIERQSPIIVTDAAEGYNPVHDLCRPIAGAACAYARRAGVIVRQYEFALTGSPHRPDGQDLVHELDDSTFAAKISAARSYAPLQPEITERLDHFGAETFRREFLRPVDDWAAAEWPSGRPLYETIGEERVAAHRYEHVIRYRDHLEPILHELRAWLDAAACAS
jgi:hypothetical protein